MQIGIHNRIPIIQQPQHRLHFRCIGLGVVAIEIQVLGVGAPTHFFGADLVGAVPVTETLMAINAENGHENKRYVSQRIAGSAPFQHFTQSQKARILAIDFACMNAALHQHHGSLLCASNGGFNGAVR